MKRVLVTGCSTAADPDHWDKVPVGVCQTGALRKAGSTTEARAICASCPSASIQGFLTRQEEPALPADASVADTPADDLFDWFLAETGQPETGQLETSQPEADLFAQTGQSETSQTGQSEADLFPPVQFPPVPDVVWVPGRAATPIGAAADLPSVDDLLRKVSGSGPSRFGWSVLSLYRQCPRKFYHRVVEGLEPPRVAEYETDDKVRLSALDLGAAVHACSAAYLENGFSHDAHEKVLDVLKPHYPLLAAEANRLWTRYLEAMGNEDESRWDVRAVEPEIVLPLKVTPLGQKKAVHTCISTRHDAVVRLLAEPHQGHLAQGRLPPGAPVPDGTGDGCVIHELKTTASLSPYSTRAFRHHGQILQALACYLRGNVVLDGKLGPPAVDFFGPLAGYVVTHVGKLKGRGEPAAAHVKRVEYVLGPEVEQLVDEFIDQAKVDLASILDRVTTQAAWPKSYLCVDPITYMACPYLELCESMGHARKEVLYKQRPAEHPLDQLLPPAAKKRGGRAKAGAEEQDK